MIEISHRPTLGALNESEAEGDACAVFKLEHAVLACEAVLSARGVGVALLKRETAKLLWCNAMARRWIGPHGFLRVEKGCLRGGELSAALARFRAEPVHWLLRNTRQPGAPLHTACTLLPSPQLHGGTSHHVLLIEDVQLEVGTDARILQGLYGLTPTLAEVAVMLSRGLTPTQIASQRGVVLATVRTQIRHLMHCMHAKNLQELQRHLALLPRTTPTPQRLSASA